MQERGAYKRAISAAYHNKILLDNLCLQLITASSLSARSENMQLPPIVTQQMDQCAYMLFALAAQAWQDNL